MQSETKFTQLMWKKASSLGKYKVQISAEVILCLRSCVGSPLKIGTGYQKGTKKF